MVIMCTCYGQKLENISSDSVIGVHAVQDENHEIQPLSSNDHHSESGDDSISDEVSYYNYYFVYVIHSLTLHY